MNLPNKLTLLRVFLIPVFVLFYVFQIPDWSFWVAIVFIVASITDFLDGYLARKMNLVTTFGKFVDPIADKILVLAALLILQDAYEIPFWVVLVLLAREFIISGFRLVASSKGVVIAADKSGKLKTFAQMLAIAMILFFGAFDCVACYVFFIIGVVLLYVSMVLSVVSCIEYLVKNKKVFKDEM